MRVWPDSPHSARFSEPGRLARLTRPGAQGTSLPRRGFSALALEGCGPAAAVTRRRAAGCHCPETRTGEKQCRGILNVSVIGMEGFLNRFT